MSTRPLTARPQSTIRQLPSLTPLRGLAALWVVLFHYTALYFPRLDITGHSYLIGKGYLAVDLFFMLSGVVMTHVYYQAFCESVTRHYRSFFAARIARLYPLHIAVLLLFVSTAVAVQLSAYAVTGTMAGIPPHGTRSVTAFVVNLFMLQGLDASEWSWNFPSWSISVEFMAYLAFPLALPAIWRASGRVQLLLLLPIVLVLALFAYVCDGDFNQWGSPIVLLRCLPEFVLGMLIYCAYRAGLGANWFAADIVGFGGLAIAIVCLHFGMPDLMIVALFPLLILAAIGNCGRFAEVANAAPLIWLGEISYSLYLIHGFVQYLATAGLDYLGMRERGHLSAGISFMLFAIMLSASLIGAHFAYHRIEIVWRKHLRALLDSRAPAKQRKPAAAGAPIIGRVAGA